MQCYPFIHSLDQTAEPVDNLQLVCASDCDAQSVEWLWPDKIPIGKVTLLIGDPGTGKSLVALDIAARASRAAPWPDEVGPPSRGGHDTVDIDAAGAARLAAPTASTLILSATDDFADTIRPRLDAAGADPRRIFFIPSIANLREDFAQLRVAVNCAPNCRLIIIDPINAYVGPSDCHFHSVVRKVLAPLAQLAAEKRIAVLAVAHLRKNDGAAIYRAAGSMGFVAAARAVWTVCRDHENPGRTLFLPLKNNLGPTACGLAYTIEPRGQCGAVAISWHSAPITTSAEEALHSAEATDLNRARQWLRKALAHGPRSASEVTQEAEHYGFHQRTLRRALHAIGGHTQNRGLLEGWWWSIPDAPTDENEEKKVSYEKNVSGIPETPFRPNDETRMTNDPSSDNSSFDIRHSSFPPPPDNPGGTQKPVPLCPLPEIFNEPPSIHPSPEPPSIPESIAFLNRLDR
ncbi:MAG: AAA family ATPase [Planctomycetes bacterium]|nr:AAA family ATPase [Planctomycetota bacterium]